MSKGEAFFPDFWVVVATLCLALLPWSVKRGARISPWGQSLACASLVGLGFSIWMLALGEDSLVARGLAAGLISVALAIAAIAVVKSPNRKKLVF